jgi:hypothetical protein
MEQFVLSIEELLGSGLFTSTVIIVGNQFGINANSTLLLSEARYDTYGQGGNYQYLQQQLKDKGEFGVTFVVNGSYGGTAWNHWGVNVQHSVFRAEGRELGSLSGSVSVDLDYIIKIVPEAKVEGCSHSATHSQIYW